MLCALIASPAFARGAENGGASGQESGGEAVAEFVSRLGGMTRIQADFDQTVSDPYGRVVDVSSGSLLLAKPNARWETTAPYPQVLVVREKLLQVYDPDLEQVTQRDISEGWEQVPLALLSGDITNVAQHFAIVRQENEGGLETFVLTPRAADAVFVSLAMRIRDGQLNQITIRDHGSQETVVNLRNYRAGVVVDSQAFILDLPPGTDVIDG